jgi:VanZ family protein
MFAFRRRSRSIASFLFAWGILMEICQGFVPLRSPEFADTLANLLGIILAWGIYHLATARDHPAVSESR